MAADNPIQIKACLLFSTGLVAFACGAAVLNVPTPRPDEDAAKVLSAVRDRVRSLSSEDRAQGVEVVLGAGVWFLRSSFSLDARDSGTSGAPVVWRGERGGKTVLRCSDEIPLSAFRPVTDAAVRARLDPSARDRIRVADVASLDIPRPSFAHEYELKPIPVPDLFCDGVREPMACWPNARADATLGPDCWAEIERILSPGDRRKGQGGSFAYAGDRPTRWLTATDAVLQGYWCYDWSESKIAVGAIDVTNRVIELRSPHLYGLAMGNPKPRRWRAIHLLEELDVPGEYYFDFKAKRLYFLPPEGARRLAVARRAQPALSVTDAHDVRFRDLAFEEGYGTAIVADKVVRVDFTDVSVRNFRGKGLVCSRARSCKALRLDVEETGCGGIDVSGGDRRTLEPGGNVVEDCRVRGYSRIQLCYANAVSLGGVGNVVRHCEFSDASHQAVFITGNRHLVEWNMISNVVLAADDSGALYKGRNPSCRENVIRHNAFVDIGAPGGHGTCAIYFDDGDMGETVEGNVFVRAGCMGAPTSGFGTVFSHGGFANVARNNVFVDCERPLGNAPWSDRFWHDYMHRPPMLKSLREDVDIFAEPYRSAYPDFAGFLDDPPPAPRRNFSENNVIVRCKTAVRGNWVTNATTVAYSEDPGFVDPAHGNYALRADSRVFRDIPGFTPIPFGEIGLIAKRNR